MEWIVSYEAPMSRSGAQNTWTKERHPSREDALTFCDVILRDGGVIASVVETADDGSIVHRLDHRDVLRELNIHDD